GGSCSRRRVRGCGARGDITLRSFRRGVVDLAGGRERALVDVDLRFAAAARDDDAIARCFAPIERFREAVARLALWALDEQHASGPALSVRDPIIPRVPRR